MKACIEDIRAKIASGKFTTREQVRLSLVARLLMELGWNTWDTEEVSPDAEFGPENNRVSVDIALFAGASCPPVSIGIAEPGTLKPDSEKPESPVSRLTTGGDATIAVMTDGNHWEFFFIHPDEPTANRCFKTIDMLEDTVDSLESAFSAYLAKERIADGSAIRDVHDYLWLSAAVQAVTDALPRARQLVTEPPYPRLPQTVAQLVSEKGIDITEEKVLKILAGVDKQKTPISAKAASVTPEPETQSEPVTEQEPSEPEQEAPEPVMEPEPVPESESPAPVEPSIDQKPSDKSEAPAEDHAALDHDIKSAGQVSKKPPSTKTSRLNLLNRKIISFSFLGNTVHPKSWKEMLITFCELIYGKHTGDFYKCLKLRTNNRLCFSKNIKDFFGHSPVQIGESDFYLLTDLNANEIVELVYKMLELFSYKKDDINIAVN